MEDIITIYKNRLDASKRYCQPHWDRAIDNYKHYLGRLDVGGIKESDYPFESKMVVSLSYDIVETIMPRMIGKDPEFTPVAIEPNDAPYENAVKLILEMEYNNPKLELLGEPIYTKIFKGVKETLITGNAVWRAYWRRQRTKQIRYLATLERAGITDEEDIAKVLKLAAEVKAGHEIKFGSKLVDSPFLDDFDIRLLPFFRYFPDPDFSEPGRFRFHIERDTMTFEEFADEAEIFGYDKAVMDDLFRLYEQKKAGHTPEIDKQFMQEYNDLFANPQQETGTMSNSDDKVQLMIVDKMWEGDKVHVVVNEKYKPTGDKGMMNPYNVMKPPFIFSSDTPMPHSYFARGQIDPIRKLEDGVTDIYNMRFDNLIQSMLNMWLVNHNFIAEGDEFLPIPNTVTSVTDIEKAVKSLTGNNVTESAYKEAQDLIALIQKITGVNDYTKGIEGTTLAGRTYGGLRLVQEAANARFIIKSRAFEKTTLKALAYFMLEMSRQFINTDRVKRIIGDSMDIEEKVVKASDLKQIKGFMDIKIIPNSTMQIDQQAEALRLNAVADRFLSNKGPFAGIPEEVFDKFLLKFLQAYNIPDAIFWVRARRNSRLELQKMVAAENKKKQEEVIETPKKIPVGTESVMQSDQIAEQPNPLEMLNNAETKMPARIPGFIENIE